MPLDPTEMQLGKSKTTPAIAALLARQEKTLELIRCGAREPRCDWSQLRAPAIAHALVNAANEEETTPYATTQAATTSRATTAAVAPPAADPDEPDANNPGTATPRKRPTIHSPRTLAGRVARAARAARAAACRSTIDPWAVGSTSSAG